MRRLLLSVLVLIGMVATSSGSVGIPTPVPREPHARTAFAQAPAFVDTLDGSPSAPAPWRPDRWDIQVYTRETPRPSVGSSQ